MRRCGARVPLETEYEDAKAKFDADMEAFKAGGGEVQPRKAKAKAKGEKKKKDLIGRRADHGNSARSGVAGGGT